MLARRQIVMAAAATVGSVMIRPLAAAPFEWRKTLLSDAGFTSDLAPRLDKLIADKRAWGPAWRFGRAGSTDTRRARSRAAERIVTIAASTAVVGAAPSGAVARQ
jgi:hypothetical protein